MKNSPVQEPENGYNRLGKHLPCDRESVWWILATKHPQTPDLLLKCRLYRKVIGFSSC
jgi:hypothetical protein